EADVAGAELWINGARAGTLPLSEPARVEAGTVVIEVSAAGYTRVRRMTSVEPGGSAREIVHLVPVSLLPQADQGEPASQPQPPVTHVPPGRGEGQHPGTAARAVSWVLIGAGAAGLAAATAFGIQTLNAKNARDKQCTNGGCSPSGVASDREAR